MVLRTPRVYILYCRKLKSPVLSLCCPNGRWKEDDSFPEMFLFSITVRRNQKNPEREHFSLPSYVAFTHSTSFVCAPFSLPRPPNITPQISWLSGCTKGQLHAGSLRSSGTNAHIAASALSAVNITTTSMYLITLTNCCSAYTCRLQDQMPTSTNAIYQAAARLWKPWLQQEALTTLSRGEEAVPNLMSSSSAHPGWCLRRRLLLPAGEAWPAPRQPQHHPLLRPRQSHQEHDRPGWAVQVAAEDSGGVGPEPGEGPAPRHHVGGSVAFGSNIAADAAVSWLPTAGVHHRPCASGLPALHQEHYRHEGAAQPETSGHLQEVQPRHRWTFLRPHPPRQRHGAAGRAGWKILRSCSRMVIVFDVVDFPPNIVIFFCRQTNQFSVCVSGCDAHQVGPGAVLQQPGVPHVPVRQQQLQRLGKGGKKVRGEKKKWKS